MVYYITAFPQKFYMNSASPHARHIACPSHPSYTWWGDEYNLRSSSLHNLLQPPFIKFFMFIRALLERRKYSEKEYELYYSGKVARYGRNMLC
jgi:hypothetical protein